MNDYSKLTKAGLLEELGKLKEQLAAAPERVTPPRTAPEALALSDCIRALDRIAETRTSYSSNNHEHGSIPRILRSLADRYNVPLVETKYEPCNQSFSLDQITTDSIAFAVQNALTQGGIR